ncbi:MAG TPA: ROK family protein [Sporolactobacillaceae bacterium]|nr:ROK family protein [Sporolactobacillaceae bacterium]
MSDQNFAIGVDLGGTKTLIGFVNRKGEILAKKQLPTNPALPPNVHLLTCMSHIKSLLKEANLSLDKQVGLGVNVPGLADSKQGRLIFAPFLNWRDVDIKSFFQKEWPELQVEVANDVNACAIGELLVGKAQGMKNFLWVTISTGIGGGLVVDRKIVEGQSLIAGEIGHVVVDWEKGAQCPCGNRGCLEAHGSGTAISRIAQEAILQEENDALATFFSSRGLPVTAETVAEAAYSGIAPAIAIYEKAGESIGRALSYSINLLNPEAIFLGGGVSRSLDLYLPSVKKVIERSVIHETNQKTPILKTGLGYEAGLIGAASLVFHAREKRRDQHV